MKAKRALLPLLLAALAFSVGGSAQAAPTVVGTDEAGDWGIGDPDADPILAAAGDALAQDLVEAAIEPAGDNVKFIIKVSALPENGGVPEFTRYTWNMFVGAEKLELDGKFTNYSRGTCDPTSGKCPPPRDPGEAPFFVRGNCVETGSVTTCQELALIKATFDPATDTITVPVPIAILSPSNPCPEISGGVNLFGDSISAMPSAFFSNGTMPHDTLAIDGKLQVC